jgi:hypothetical protein
MQGKEVNSEEKEAERNRIKTRSKQLKETVIQEEKSVEKIQRMDFRLSDIPSNGFTI